MENMQKRIQTILNERRKKKEETEKHEIKTMARNFTANQRNQNTLTN